MSDVSSREVDSESLRGEWDREMRNCIELVTGFLFGKIVGATLALSAFMRLTTGAPPFDFLRTLSQAPATDALKFGAPLVGVLLFLRVGLRPLTKVFYSDGTRRKWGTPRKSRVARWILAWCWILMSIGVVLFSAMESTPFWIIWFGLMLGGISGATLWAGRRWISGDEKRCARCGYLRDDPALERCPECGTQWLKPWKTVIGHRGVNRPMLIGGFCTLGGLGLVITIALVMPPPSP